VVVLQLLTVKRKVCYEMLHRAKRRRDDNIKMDSRGIEWEAVDWVHLAQDRDKWCVLVNTIMNLRIP
jgi:hypothetical protein